MQVHRSDPDRIFESPVFAEMVGVKDPPRLPGCATRGECYCKTDSDCGFHFKCVPGNTFPEYLVCKNAKSVAVDSIVGKASSLLASARSKLLGGK